MPYSLTIPFFTVKLHLSTGGTILNPLMDTKRLSINEKSRQVAEKFRSLFQKELLNKGNYWELLSLYEDSNIYKTVIEVDFAESRDGISHPEFMLAFDYFFKENDNGIWAVIPSLGIETFTQDESDLDEALRSAIRLEFVRKRRLTDLRKVIATIWYHSVELITNEINLSFPGLKELESQEESQELLLPKVARPLSIKEQVVFGRKAELEQLTRLLKGKFNRNVIIVGASGVGKTALVWELVHQQKKRKVTGTIWETTASTMIKELTADTGWEDNLAGLCQELTRSNDRLFIRNFLELFEVGKYVGNEVSMADFMRSYVSRGELSIITECTEEEFARIQLRHSNYINFFQILKLEEPSTELEDIIIKKVDTIAGARGIQISEDAILETIRLNRRFTPYAGFPGKPIRFLESLLINARKNLETLNQAEVIRSFCEETGMPQFMVDPAIPMKIQAVQEHFNKNIFGQQKAVNEVSGLLASVKTALTRTGKPIASLLFVGPTGVGKTEMGKVLAEFMFGNRERMLRFDMSEFSDPYSVMRLTGESYFTDGLLTSAVRREPFSVLLFDEIEKAHPDFYDLLLQILSEGRLTDSRGKLANFCSTIIIMTSNIGAANLQTNRISWSQGVSTEEVTSHFMSAVQKHFRPELYNRIDQVIPFEPLSPDSMRYVVDREISLFRKREGINFRKMDFFISEAALDYLAESGYDTKYGARQLQRAIREELIIPLSRQLNLYEYDDQLIVRAERQEKGIHLEIEADPLGLELLLEELDKINYADYSSELRRQVLQLKEGHSFVRMLSGIDILKRKHQRLGDRFWKNKKEANEYSSYLELSNQLEELQASIEKHEMDLSMSCIGLEPYNATIVEQLKTWEALFFQLKVKLYTQLHPEVNRTSMGIYGTALEPIFNFYTQLFQRLDLEYEAQMIWFRESHYQNTVAQAGGDRRRLQEVYIIRDWQEDDPTVWEEQQRDDVLYGIEFEVKGLAVRLLLEEERGLQKWTLAPGDQRLFVVQTEEGNYERPTNVHRKEFYRGTPRRINTPDHLKDTKLKINREVPAAQQLDLILEQIQENFKAQLAIALG